MKPQFRLRKRSAFVSSVALALLVGTCHISQSVAEEHAGARSASAAATREDQPTRPPAVFFSINAVLAKLDRQRGRGPGAIRLAALTPANVATDASTPVQDVPAVGTEPFGLFKFLAPEGLLWRKWRGLEGALLKEQSVLDQCRADAASCPQHATQFLRLISAIAGKSGRARLEEANRGVNVAVRYVSDFIQHGEADRWSTPLATFGTAKGDCEDYAIAKYVALREAGFPRDDLQLLLVRDRAVRQDHAVLAARLDGHWLLLDNRRSDLIDDTEAASLAPLFAINHTGVYLFAAPYVARQLTGDIDAAPAASDKAAEWGSEDAVTDGAYSGGALPLLL